MFNAREIGNRTNSLRLHETSNGHFVGNPWKKRHADLTFLVIAGVDNLATERAFYSDWIFEAMRINNGGFGCTSSKSFGNIQVDKIFNLINTDSISISIDLLRHHWLRG